VSVAFAAGIAVGTTAVAPDVGATAAGLPAVIRAAATSVCSAARVWVAGAYAPLGFGVGVPLPHASAGSRKRSTVNGIVHQ
jgi:hypothetical protein